MAMVGSDGARGDDPAPVPVHVAERWRKAAEAQRSAERRLWGELQRAYGWAAHHARERQRADARAERAERTSRETAQRYQATILALRQRVEALELERSERQLADDLRAGRKG
jgi:hypothetical protein